MSYYFPPEWEEHKGTLLTWPQRIEVWEEDLYVVQSTWARIAALLSKHEEVFILLDPKIEPSSFDEVKQHLYKHNAVFEKIHFLPIKTNDVWIRDYGPIWIEKKELNEDWVLVFRFDGWGKKYFPYQEDDQAAQAILNLFYPEKENRKILNKNYVLEGGSLETNGEILIITESCNLFREPYMSKEEYESEFQTSLGIKQTLWLKGALPGDGTDGHIDMLTRFVSKEKILTSICGGDEAAYPILKENKRRLENFFLKQKSNPFKIIDLPLPRQRYRGGLALARTYANFYIANHQVLVPVYNEASDEGALAILQECFPERDIEAIDASQMILQGGALHCMTMQIPKLAQISSINSFLK